ncbi:uncharacterized protein [Epargyreus clarus]|uniref:uncharacterized protein n=1 Tax=Epargyreus clarus TaxID=520877 RepID=UPI003C2DABB2
MATLHVTCLSFLLAAGLAAPTPGRIPKVYNALITSNQNLEPSKAYPVYQPVLHNAFPFPFHTVYYGDYPIGNSLLPAPGLLPKVPNPEPAPVPAPAATPESPSSPSSESPKEEEPATEAPQPAEEASPQPDSDNATPAPQSPPKTEAPIPLNEFGLPPQVLPIGRLGPTYDFTQFGSFPYTYPGFRFYDPYDPFGFNPYAGLPLYRPITNVIGPSAPVLVGKEEASTAAPVSPSAQDSQAPPSEPSDLNVLNYSAKDPAIPNVPPPPLPSGGLKSDKSE